MWRTTCPVDLGSQFCRAPILTFTCELLLTPPYWCVWRYSNPRLHPLTTFPQLSHVTISHQLILSYNSLWRPSLKSLFTSSQTNNSTDVLRPFQRSMVQKPFHWIRIREILRESVSTCLPKAGKVDTLRTLETVVLSLRFVLFSTVKDQQREWKIPPCILNWKNPKGYDYLSLSINVKINDNFAEALYVAE